MCLIIDRPAGVPIPESLLDNGMTSNPDGWGIMWADKGSVFSVKGMRRGKFHKALDRLGDRACTIHFRFTTHGKTTVDNCHPFPVADGRFALMHNGILQRVPEFVPDRSDTWHFAEYVLDPMLRGKPEMFGTRYLRETLEDMIGQSNKFVIMGGDGATMRVNEELGTEWQGLWLSNAHSCPRKATAVKTQSTLGQWKDWNASDKLASDYRKEADEYWSKVTAVNPDRCDVDDIPPPGGSLHATDADLIELETSTVDAKRDGLMEQADMAWDLYDLVGFGVDEIEEWICQDPAAAANLIYSHINWDRGH